MSQWEWKGRGKHILSIVCHLKSRRRRILSVFAIAFRMIWHSHHYKFCAKWSATKHPSAELNPGSWEFWNCIHYPLNHTAVLHISFRIRSLEIAGYWNNFNKKWVKRRCPGKMVNYNIYPHSSTVSKNSSDSDIYTQLYLWWCYRGQALHWESSCMFCERKLGLLCRNGVFLGKFDDWRDQK